MNDIHIIYINDNGVDIYPVADNPDLTLAELIVSHDDDPDFVTAVLLSVFEDRMLVDIMDPYAALDYYESLKQDETG